MQHQNHWSNMREYRLQKQLTLKFSFLEFSKMYSSVMLAKIQDPSFSQSIEKVLLGLITKNHCDCDNVGGLKPKAPIPPAAEANRSLMASSWVKSLHCKSQACADVYHPTNLPHSGCTKSLRNLKDVVEKPKRKKHQKQRCAFTPNQQETRVRVRVSDSIPTPTTDPCFPTLTELSVGHSSRNIVEIIFYNSWNRSQSASSASKIELLFKVQNLPKTVARFEEYREMVKMKSRARDPGRKDGRCVADGNEVLRFHCAGPAGRQVDAVSRFCSFSGGGTAIRTFSGSGEAHESFGSYKGRRAMLVCRVIAGRVCKNLESYFQGCGFDSVAGENGQLLVFDSTAVLPCFLIIYHF